MSTTPVTDQSASPEQRVHARLHSMSPESRFGLKYQVLTSVALLNLIVITLAYQYPDHLITHTRGAFATEIISMRVLFRLYVVLLGGLLTGFLLQPPGAWLFATLRPKLSPGTKRVVVALGLVTACLFVSTCLITWGRHQFGAWDFEILTDVGWRQYLGQTPYVDFVTPTPPFFNWGSLLAFRLFGVTWNANLYLAALFSCITMVWTYFLLRGLRMGAPAALGTSLTIQAAAMLSCCFWWYNNTTLILSSLFYITALLLVRAPSSRLAQGSLFGLTALLPLTKPNIAGLTMVGCLALVLFCSLNRKRVLLLTLAGLALCVLISIFVMHVSWPAMIAIYRGIAKERGAASTFGWQSLTVGEQRLTLLWLVLVFLPLLSIWPPFWSAFRDRRWRQMVFWLIFPLSAIVTAYGVAGNGEWRGVECTLLIAAMGALAFVLRAESVLLQRFVVTLMCGMFAADLYVGEARLRVFTVGVHQFFEWTDNDHRFQSGFLKDLRGSATLVEVDREVQAAVHAHRGPFFLGQRIDFEYPALRLPPPAHWATFFQPGTAFDRHESATLVSAWREQRFQTLIFLKDEYLFYPDDFLRDLQEHYTRDDRFPWLSVYRRLPGS